MLDTFALVLGRGMAAGLLKALLTREPDLQGSKQNIEHVQFPQGSSLGTAQQPHSENALGEGTGEISAYRGKTVPSKTQAGPVIQKSQSP